MPTIGESARKFNLSRSTPLYYDRIGLLRPTGRKQAGYRVYSVKDIARLEKIVFFRNTGLGLKEIGCLLGRSASRLKEILERQLLQLDERIRALQGQQQLILDILCRGRLPRLRGMDKARWTELLRSVGLDDAAMRRWHAEFERITPDGHLDFLSALGLEEKEIAAIRRWSKEVGGGNSLKKHEAVILQRFLP